MINASRFDGLKRCLKQAREEITRRSVRRMTCDVICLEFLDIELQWPGLCEVALASHSNTHAGPTVSKSNKRSEYTHHRPFHLQSKPTLTNLPG